MSKTIIIVVAGVVVAIAAAAGGLLFFRGTGASEAEAGAVATPVSVPGKLGPHITLEDRVFNLRGGIGAQAYLKLQTVIEFETTSEEWAKVLNGCVSALRVSEPMVSTAPRFTPRAAQDLEGAQGDPCAAAEAELQDEFAREIGTGRQLIEDAVLSIVSTRTAAEVGTPEGKQALKDEIRREVGKLIPEPHVTRVLFTNFITQ